MNVKFNKNATRSFKHKLNAASKLKRSSAKPKRTVFSPVNIIKYLLWFIFLLLLLLLYFIHDLPDLNTLSKVGRQPSITILSQDNKKLLTMGDYYAQPVELSKLSPAVIHIFIATEDRRYFNHYGIDCIGLMRAIFNNFTKHSVVQGGSTITQQLAKNFLVTHKLFQYHERSYKRKIQEMILAVWLECKFTKAQILTLYLNRTYFGGGTFGLSAAARHYFNKSPYKLSIYEAALIAGLLKAPTSLSPITFPERSQIRTKQVVLNYVNAGFGNQEIINKYRYPYVVIKKAGQSFARYFCDYLLSELEEIFGIINQDLIVYSTCNTYHQRVIENILNKQITEHALKSNISQSAAVTLDRNGQIKGLVGGINYFQSPFNRAFQSVRQPGSAIKLFIFLAALEAGWSLEDNIADTPIKYKKWHPKNFGWKSKGKVSFQDAFAYSINTAAIRLAEDVGYKKIQDLIRRFNIQSNQPSNLTIALGTGEISLLDLTAAYNVINNHGVYIKPHSIRKVTTVSGKVLYTHQLKPKRIISQVCSTAMEKLLKAVVEYGTGRHYPLSIPSAGKTGTTQNYKDAWFIGYVPQQITGIWVGNDHNQPMYKVTGSGLPHQIWHEIMTRSR